ncbi:MAG: phosphotransferase [Planctomycetota bacterium]|nr:phosphotransferase [Planctomycetota bacterium]
MSKSLIQNCDPLFSLRIKKQFCDHFSINDKTLTDLDGFSSYVFRGQVDNQNVVLKISHSSRLDRSTIESELDFVQFLHSKNCAVANAIILPGANRVLAISDGEGHEFFGYCFEWVDGRCFEDVDKDEASLQQLGRALGTIHNASEEFTSGSAVIKRPSIHSNVDYQAADILPKSESDIIVAYNKLIEDIDRIPQVPHLYGLIHSDAHDGNLIQKANGDLVFIDFDDCEFHYFINDLAIMLYTFLPPDDTDPKVYTEFVFANLLKGYLAVRSTPAEHFQCFPLFLKFRAFMIHMLSAKLATLTAAPDKPEAIERRRKRIRSNFADLESLLSPNFQSIATMLRPKV